MNSGSLATILKVKSQPSCRNFARKGYQAGRGHGWICNPLIIRYYFNSSVETRPIFGHVSTLCFVTNWISISPDTRAWPCPASSVGLLRQIVSSRQRGERNRLDVVNDVGWLWKVEIGQRGERKTSILENGNRHKSGWPLLGALCDSCFCSV